MPDELVVIGDAAARFGITVSTLRYWDERGLVHPEVRRSGRRYYNEEQLHRIGLVQLWQESALMSLDEIAAMLAGGDDHRDWREIVRGRVAAVEQQIAVLRDGREHLRHLLTCPQSNPADNCPQLRTASRERQRYPTG